MLLWSVRFAPSHLNTHEKQLLKVLKLLQLLRSLKLLKVLPALAFQRDTIHRQPGQRDPVHHQQELHDGHVSQGHVLEGQVSAERGQRSGQVQSPGPWRLPT